MDEVGKVFLWFFCVSRSKTPCKPLLFGCLRTRLGGFVKFQLQKTCRCLMPHISMLQWSNSRYQSPLTWWDVGKSLRVEWLQLVNLCWLYMKGCFLSLATLLACCCSCAFPALPALISGVVIGICSVLFEDPVNVKYYEASEDEPVELYIPARYCQWLLRDVFLPYICTFRQTLRC